MSNETLRANIEALLFVNDEPLSLNRLIDSLEEVERNDVKKAIEDIQKTYSSDDHGLQLVEIAGGYQFCTKDAFSESINKFFESKRKRTLSKAALETMAIIAYKQPITRAEIEVIRGVSADGAVHKLLERKMIKIGGRKEIPGRPFFYNTTKTFLQYFGLKNLSDLPKIDDIKKGLQEPDTVQAETAEVISAEPEQETQAE